MSSNCWVMSCRCADIIICCVLHGGWGRTSVLVSSRGAWEPGPCAAPRRLSNSRSCGQPPATPRRCRRQAGERRAFPRSPARHVSRSPQQLEVCELSGEPRTELGVLRRCSHGFLAQCVYPDSITFTEHPPRATCHWKHPV